MHSLLLIYWTLKRDQMHFLHPIPQTVSTEEIIDCLCDFRNDCAVENQGQSRQQQSAKNNGNDDLYCIRDVEISALVGESRTGAVYKAVSLTVDKVCNLFHGNLLK